MKKTKYILFIILCLLLTNYKVDATTGLCVGKKLNSDGYCTIDAVSISRISIPDSFKPLIFTDGNYPLNYSYSGNIPSDKKQLMFCLDGNLPQPGSQTYSFAKPFNVTSKGNDYQRAIASVYETYIDEVIKAMNNGTSESVAYDQYLQMINVVMRLVTVKYGYNLKGGASDYFQNHMKAYKNIIKQLEGQKVTGTKLKEDKTHYPIVKKWYCNALLSCQNCTKVTDDTIKYCNALSGVKKSTPKEFKVKFTPKNEGITTEYSGSGFTKKIPINIKGLSNFKLPGYDITVPSFKIKSVKCENTELKCTLESPAKLNDNILSSVSGDEYDFNVVAYAKNKEAFKNKTKTKVIIEYEKYHILDANNLAILRYTMGVHELQRMLVLMPKTPIIEKINLSIDLPSMCESKIEGGVPKYSYGGNPRTEYNYLLSGCCNLDPNYLTDPKAIEHYSINCSTEDTVVLANVCRNDGSGAQSHSYVYQKPIGTIMGPVNNAEELFDKGIYLKNDLDKVLNKYYNNWDEVYTKNGISSSNTYCKMYTSEKQDILYPGTVESTSGQFFIFNEFQQPSVKGEIYANYHTDVKRWLADYKIAIESEKSAYTSWQSELNKADSVSVAASSPESMTCSYYDAPCTIDEETEEKTCTRYESSYTYYSGTATGTYYNGDERGTTQSGASSSWSTRTRCSGSDRPTTNVRAKEDAYKAARDNRKNLEKYKKECEDKTDIRSKWKYELSPDLDFYYKQKINSYSGGSEEIIESIPMEISYASDGKYWKNVSDRNPILLSGSQSGAKSTKTHTFQYGGGSSRTTHTQYYDNTLDYRIGYEQTLYYKPSTYYYSLVPSGKYITSREVHSDMSVIDVGYVYNVELTNYEGEYETWFEMKNIGHLMRNTSIKPKLRSNIQYSVDLYLEDNKSKYPNHNDEANGEIFASKCFYDNKEVLYERDCIDCEDPNFNAQYFYRSISINNINPNNRTNTNWATTKGQSAKNAIESTGDNIYDDSKKYLEYSFTLSPLDMKEIKDYNKSTEYNDFNLRCKNGKECESAFIDDWAVKSNTTDLLNDTRNNKWKYFVNGVWNRGNISNVLNGGTYPLETENYSDWP